MGLGEERKKEDKKAEEEAEQKEMTKLLSSDVVDQIDYKRLIDVLLIAKSDFQIRSGAEAIIKGLWNTADDAQKQKIKTKLISKLRSIKSYGQNSSKYLNTISYIFKKGELVTDQEKDQIADSLKQSL